jgi:UDP-N-acetylglucosamine transferase subunit ALG13
LILVTVGSMFPFDRLVRAMDELVATGRLHGEVRAQIGSGRYEPKSMPFDRFLDKPAFDRLLASADSVISHAGIGTISTALSAGKPLLVLPRRTCYGEIVNDHQVATARRFGELGHLLVAYSELDIVEGLQKLKTFTPLPRLANARGIAERVGLYLKAVERERQGRRA